MVLIRGRLLVFLAHKRLVDDDLRLTEFQIAGFRIKRRADDLTALAVFTTIRGSERCRDSLDDCVAGDAFLCLELIERGI